MNYILAAILSNLSYAIADNASGLAAKKNRPLNVAFWTCVCGLAIFTLPALLFFSHEFKQLTFANIQASMHKRLYRGKGQLGV